MKTPSERKEIAATILSQLGGKRFIAMTGARNFVYGDSDLSFHIPTIKGINAVRVILEPDDTYTVEFLKVSVKAPHRTVKKTVNYVFYDSLRSVFEENTGLYTSL